MKTLCPRSTRKRTSELCGREVEDVVLHDPGRDDQHRLGEDVRRLRRVLDQLDQLVAVDDLARGHRDLLTDPEGFRALLPAPGDGPLPVLPEVDGAVHEVGAAGPERRLDDLGVQRRHVGRRHHVQDLPGDEGHHLLVMGGDAGDVGGGVVPPLLREEEGLGDEGVWGRVPGLVVEALILR